MEHSHPNWGLHSLACRRPPGIPWSSPPGCFATILISSSVKDRPTVRAKGSLAWQNKAGLQDLGILNQLLWQVWPAWLSRVHPPPGGSPASCWRVWDSWVGHSPRQQSQRGWTGLGAAGWPHTPRGSHPSETEPATPLSQALWQARAFGQT